MSRKAHETALPKLRFPEFQDAEAWEIPPLGELMDGVSTRNRDNEISRVFTNSAVSGIIDQRDFFDKDIATAGNTDNYTVIELGDYVYNPRISEFAPVGPTSRNKLGQGIVSPLYTVFRFRNSNNNKFYDYYFGSTHWQNSLKAIGNSGARHDRMGISLTQLRLVKVPYPSLAEQQKIAATLSSLDALLTAQTAKLTALQAHKRGLMQDLLPAEGETVPKRRFLKFQDAGEWEVSTLDNLASFRRGSFPQPYGLPKWYDEINGIPFIQVFDVNENFRLKPTTKNKISKLATKQSVFIPKETVIVTLQGSIGRVAITQYDAYIDRTLLLFEKFFIPMNKTFFGYVLFLLFEIEKEKAPGGVIKTITKEVLSDFKVSIAPIEEQQKVADCLSSLDNLITAQSQKIDALKLHKKGLMQALFPTIRK